jgi:uncharacterized membrane protein YhhN
MGMKFALGATVLGLLAMLAAGKMGLGSYALLFKMIASTGFIALAYFAGGLQTNYGKAILIALFFSWWGDFFLSAPGGWFLWGLIAFFIGHVFFGVAFLVHGVQWKWVVAALPVLLLIGVGIYFWLGDKPGDLRIPVYCYMTVISLMVALSFGARGAGASWWVVAGALLFYGSDLFVARGRFVTKDIINPLVGLPMYYAAQIVFAYTCKLVR